jgi:hypothetical protein
LFHIIDQISNVFAHNFTTNEVSPAELIELVHLQIHSLLQEGYGLQTTNMYMNDGQMDMD